MTACGELEVLQKSVAAPKARRTLRPLVVTTETSSNELHDTPLRGRYLSCTSRSVWPVREYIGQCSGDANI